MSLTAQTMNRPHARTELQRQLNWPQFRGKVFYCCSVTGSDAYSGRSPKQPLATLAAAMALCTANQGDAIVILEGHSETYSTTGSKLTNKAGVQVIGLGEGADRPTFTFSHTAATWTVSGAKTHIENVLFVTGVNLVTTFGTISADDVSLVDCETRDTTDIEVVDAFIVTGKRLKVVNHFHNGYISGDANERVFKLTAANNALFEGCRFITKVTTGIINFVTTLSSGVVIRNCTFYVNGTSDGSKNVVDTVGSSVKSIEGSADMSLGSLVTASDSSTLLSATASVGVVAGSTATSAAVSTVLSRAVIASTSLSTNTSFLTSASTSLSSILSKVLTL